MTDVISAEGLTKVYRSRKSEVRALDGLDLTVKEGTVLGLLGPNGAGKTTVFTIIMGLIKPDRGEVRLDGHKITRLPLFQRGRLGIGYLPQEPSIFRGLSVRDNILAVLEQHVRSRKAREARLEELLTEFGIGHIAGSNAMALSGGERRRTEIARAVAGDPAFMLLDEPFAGVDPIAVSEVKGLVRQLTQRGIGVLITDHSVRETLSLVDRAYLIHDGRVMIQGKPEVITNDPEARRVYLGDSFSV